MYWIFMECRALKLREPYSLLSPFSFNILRTFLYILFLVLCSFLFILGELVLFLFSNHKIHSPAEHNVVSDVLFSKHTKNNLIRLTHSIHRLLWLKDRYQIAIQWESSYLSIFTAFCHSVSFSFIFLFFFFFMRLLLWVCDRMGKCSLNT